MGWRQLLGVSALLLGAWTGACSSSDDAKPAATCPPDDPATPEINEAECKAIATVAAGGQAVTRRNCVGCHGNDMSGSTTPLPNIANTALGETVELYPPNLTSDPTTGVGSPDKGGKWTDDAIALAIRSGVDYESESLCPQMNHFATMSDFEAYSIVMYLRSIPPVNKKVPRSVCPPLKTKEQQNEPQ